MSKLSVGTIEGLPINGNVISVPAGHSLYASGHVIQVSTVENTGRYSQGFSTNTLMDVAGMELSITPKSPNSKIIVMARWFGEFTAADRVYNTVFGISRNNTQVGRQADAGGTIISGITMPVLSYEGTDASSTPEVSQLFFTDTPQSVAPVTYKLTMISDGGGTLYTNRAVNWSGQAGGFELGTSSMVLMEVAP